MTKTEAIGTLAGYLKRHHIPFAEGIDEGACRLTMVYGGYRSVPGGILEACVWFYESVMEARVYYCESGAELCRKSSHRGELYRLLNYCNARLWPAVDGGGTLYQSSFLYAPRFYMTEDEGFDITMTTVIPYDFYDIAPVETADFLTVACPGQLAELSIPIFSVLLGRIDAEEAAAMIGHQ